MAQATRLKIPKTKFVAGLIQESFPVLATFPVTNPAGQVIHLLLLLSPYVFIGQAVQVMAFSDSRKYPNGQNVGAAVGVGDGSKDGR